jgi:hypothetical protein
VTREKFRQRFEDTSGYFPLNSAETDRYPLRWKPLVLAIDGLGRFAIQVFIFASSRGRQNLASSHD